LKFEALFLFDRTNKNKTVNMKCDDNVCFVKGLDGEISRVVLGSFNRLEIFDFAGNPDLQIFTMSAGTLTSVFTGAPTTQSAAAGPVAIAALP